MPCTLLLSRSTSCLCPRSPKRMFLWRTAWEDSVPLQSKKQICLLSIMVKIASLLGQSSGRLAYHILYRIRFPKLGVSQLPCKPTACATFMWTSLSHLYRTWGAKENWYKYAESHVACCAVSVISPLSLIQASGVFLPMKLWQTNLLLCN